MLKIISLSIFCIISLLRLFHSSVGSLIIELWHQDVIFRSILQHGTLDDAVVGDDEVLIIMWMCLLRLIVESEPRLKNVCILLLNRCILQPRIWVLHDCPV